MITKIDASKLIQLLSTAEKRRSLSLILTDNPVFQKVITDSLESTQRVRVFTGKNSIEDYVNYLSTCGLFEAAQICLIELPEKLTQKSWNEAKKSLARIPLP